GEDDVGQRRAADAVVIAIIINGSTTAICLVVSEGDVCECRVANTTIGASIVHGSSEEIRPIAAEGNVGQRRAADATVIATVIHTSTQFECQVASKGDVGQRRATLMTSAFAVAEKTTAESVKAFTVGLPGGNDDPVDASAGGDGRRGTVQHHHMVSIVIVDVGRVGDYATAINVV